MKNFLHNIAQKGKSALAWLGQLAYNVYKAIAKFIFKLLYEEYELTVWYLKDSVRDKDGNITTTRTSKRYLLKKISKKTPKHIKGKDMEGRAFEIRTVEPFDYQIRKIY